MTKTNETQLPTVQVLDTTLRDGEQTPGVAYTPDEKRQLARALLCDVGVDRVEIASAGVSPGERQAVADIVRWAKTAGVHGRIDVLGFCDDGASARFAAELGAPSLNLLTKGSERHCRAQLQKTPAEHFAAIERSVRAAQALGVAVRAAYLEDWSRGSVDSPGYVQELVAHLLRVGVRRIILADTLGCLGPDSLRRQVQQLRAAHPCAALEIHAHNDYGLATANTLAAVAEGVDTVHVTVNGLGERAGNASLAEVVAALHDHAHVRTGVAEARLGEVSQLVERLSGKALAANAPVTGRDVFTQTAGIHADGDRKAELYASQLAPQRFARSRGYALGKLAGRASLDQNLDRLGLCLTPSQRDRVLAHIVQLGDEKRVVQPAQLPALIAEILGPCQVVSTREVT